MMQYQYDAAFQSYTAQLSRRSAEGLVPVVAALLKPGSVLDVGCSRGVWLAAWQAAGVEDYFGVDGDYVRPQDLVIDPARFRALDLAQPFDLGRRFDLVQCLEVAEHVPAAAASVLMDSLTRHGDAVLFSAAPPGQGGEFHVNEQPYGYWRDLFRERGFIGLDCIRPAVLSRPDIQPWYRCNSFLFLRPAVFDALPDFVKLFRLNEHGPVADIAPASQKLRRALTSLLPPAAVNRVARLKARLESFTK